ncbi:MAG: PolC-type DNA polymerase III, partial [Oscillospiraceae bacterium]|nr:PolC-type DNA polymerase III [Oscillospiraceae bacterium]
SNSNVKYFYRRPRMPRSEIESLREGLILGTACEAGELYQGILAGKSHEELLKIASFYDYIEIMPTALNAFLTRPHAPSKKKVRKAEAHDFTFDTMNNGDEQEDTTIQLDENGMLPPRVDGQEGLREINRTLAKIARDLDKPLIATGDVHFLEEKDAIYREILQVGQSYDDAGDGAPLYLRSTQEMLDEFAYLGEETAYEAVVKNPQAIADMCEELIPIPKGSFPPEIEGAKEELRESCYKKARSLYGDPLPEIVATRLERELVPIIDNGFAVMYVSSQKLVEYSNSLGYEVGSRGSVGSSVVASFAGISEVNPLPPHYLCGKCRYSEFIQDGTVESGFDLPRKSCPKCGADLGRDGHDIPFETFLGFKAEKQPDIDLNFSGDIQNDVHTYTEQIFGKENCFKAGTIQQLQDKTAFGFAKKYLDRKVQARALEQGFSGTTQELWAIKDNTTRPAEVMRLANGCVGVKRTTGQHPGGMVVVPSNMEIEDFSPVQYPADKTERDMTTTQFDFKSMLHDTLLKLDILGHDVPTMYKHLEDLTGIPVTKADVTDPRLYELFQSPEPLGISAEELGVPTGTLSIPEMGTRNTIQMLVDAKPKTFADLLQISGLSHGTDVWHGNAKELIVSGECTISDVIGLRDNIMLTLMHKGMDSGMAFQITEIVRKGTAKYKLTREHIDAMNALDLPHWYVDSCMKIKYMFPKAHAAAYVLGAMRLAWYKLYHPTEYYAVFLTVKGGALEAGTILKGQKAVARRVRELAALLLQKNASPKEIVSHDILEIVNEMLLRGIALLPVSLYYSTANVYTIEDGKIRLPFSALGGIGDKAAVDCAEARNKVKGKFNSIEDFQHISEVSSTVMDALREAGCFAGMDEAAQLSLF